MTLRDDDFAGEMPRSEQGDQLALIAEQLHRERPVPRAAFRGQLRRRLVSDAPAGRRASRLSRRWGLASLATGVLLLAFAGAGLAGIGPLAPVEPRELSALLNSAF